MKLLTKKEVKFMQRLESQGKNFAVAGVVLIVPALTLVASGFSQSIFGARSIIDFLPSAVSSIFFHPLIILGGLLLAVGLNLLPILRLKFGSADGTMSGTFVVKTMPANIVLVSACMVLASVIFLYLLAENFASFARWWLYGTS